MIPTGIDILNHVKKKTQMCNKRQKGNLDRFFNKKPKSCIGMYTKVSKMFNIGTYLLYFNYYDFLTI